MEGKNLENHSQFPDFLVGKEKLRKRESKNVPSRPCFMACYMVGYQARALLLYFVCAIVKWRGKKNFQHQEHRHTSMQIWDFLRSFHFCRNSLHAKRPNSWRLLEKFQTLCLIFQFFALLIAASCVGRTNSQPMQWWHYEGSFFLQCECLAAPGPC